MLLEHRKSFQWIVGLAAFALATTLCWSLVWPFPPSSAASTMAALALCAAATVGFERLFVLLLPPLLVKLFPRLDAAS